MTLKVNKQTKDASVISEQQDTVKEVYARVCNSVDSEYITEEAREYPEKQDGELSIYPGCEKKLRTQFSFLKS